MLDMNAGLHASSTDTAAANAQAVVDLANPGVGRRWSIGGVAWSYASAAEDTSGGSFIAQLDTSAGILMHITPIADTTGAASLGVSDTSGTLVFCIEVTDIGYDSIVFAEPVKFPPEHRVQVVMPDGGGSQRLQVLGAKRI